MLFWCMIMSATPTTPIPNFPRPIGSVKDTTQLDGANRVTVIGTVAYVCCKQSSSSRLTAVDVSDPTNPSVLGSLVDHARFSSCIDTHTDGTYVYVAHYDADSLIVVGVGTPASPNVAGSLTDSTNMDGASGVYVDGGYAYVAAKLSRSLAVVNVGTPASPTLAGSVSDSTDLLGAYRVVVSGSYAYVCRYVTSGLAVTTVDVSNKASPSVAGTLTRSGMNSFHAMALSGSHLLLWK